MKRRLRTDTEHRRSNRGERWWQSSGRPVKSEPRVPAVCQIHRGTSAVAAMWLLRQHNQPSSPRETLTLFLSTACPDHAHSRLLFMSSSPGCAHPPQLALLPGLAENTPFPRRWALLWGTPTCWKETTRSTEIKNKEQHSFYVTHACWTNM